MAGLALTAKTDASPCPRVEITVDGLHATTPSTLTIWRSAGGQRLKVRGADAVTAAAAFFIVDYEAPLGRRVDYNVEVTGPTIPATTAGTVSLDVSQSWIQDPLAPTNSVPVDSASGGQSWLGGQSLTSLSYPAPSEVVQVLGATFPVLLGGQRAVAQSIPLTVLTNYLNATEELRGILTTAQPVLFRPQPAFSQLPGTAFLSVRDMTEEPVTTFTGGSLTRWRLTGDLVSPPGIFVVVPVWAYQDVAALWSTYASVTATGRTYLGMLKDPTP